MNCGKAMNPDDFIFLHGRLMASGSYSFTVGDGLCRMARMMKLVFIVFIKTAEKHS